MKVKSKFYVWGALMLSFGLLGTADHEHRQQRTNRRRESHLVPPRSFESFC